VILEPDLHDFGQAAYPLQMTGFESVTDVNQNISVPTEYSVHMSGPNAEMA
jgi:hypothetical protein